MATWTKQSRFGRSLTLHKKGLALHSARGFTLAELVIGMAITTIVMTAMASFTMSVGTAWKANEQEEAASLITNVAAARLGREVRMARLPGAAYNGSLDNSNANEAAVVLWRGDTNGDNIIQLSELEVIAYEKASQALVRYRPGTLVTNSNVTSAEFNNTAMIATAKSIFERKVLIPKVDGARLYRIDKGGTGKPAMEWVLRIVQNGQTHVLSLTLTFRSAAAPLS